MMLLVSHAYKCMYLALLEHRQYEYVEIKISAMVTTPMSTINTTIKNLAALSWQQYNIILSVISRKSIIE